MSGINKYPAQYFVQLQDCPNTLVANDILQVNSAGTAVTQASVSSLVGPNVGSGVAGNIAVFGSSAPPILSDSGVTPADLKAFTATTPDDWATSPPATIALAINRLASLIYTLNSNTPIP